MRSGEPNGFRVLPLVPPEPLSGKPSFLACRRLLMLSFPLGIRLARVGGMPLGQGYCGNAMGVDLLVVGPRIDANPTLFEFLEWHDGGAQSGFGKRREGNTAPINRVDEAAFWGWCRWSSVACQHEGSVQKKSGNRRQKWFTYKQREGAFLILGAYRCRLEGSMTRCDKENTRRINFLGFAADLVQS